MNIFKELLKLRANAYAKYSKYKVACIVKDNNDNFYYGVNVENAVYPLTICAEQTAIVNAITNGAKNIQEVHLLCSNLNDFGIPCGKCRQMMVEFMKPTSFIYVYNDKGDIKKYALDELLPNAFSSSFLKE